MKNKLQYDEQYGYWSYYVNGNEISDLKEVEVNGNKYKVVGADNSDVNYEMGRHEIVNSTKYYIRVPFEGTTVLVDLIQLLNRKIPNWLSGQKRSPKAKAKVVATKFCLEPQKPSKPAPIRARIR